MNDISNIEKIVMQRIKRIRVLRAIFSNGALASFVLALALWGIGKEVWVSKVFANGPQDILGHLTYLAYAFTHTHLIVQILSLLTLTALIILAREVSRMLAHSLIIPKMSS